MPVGRWRLISSALITLGLIVSAYLMYRAFSLLTGEAAGGIDLCSAVFGAGCDDTLLSTTSWQLGIPLAGWGVVYYAVLASLLVLARVLGQAFDREATLGALAVAVAGACGSVVLATMMIVGSAPFCPLCMVVHGINLALVPALKIQSGRTTGELLKDLRAGSRYLLSSKAVMGPQTRWKTVGLITTALVGVVLYQWMLVESDRRWVVAQRPPDAAQVLAAYEAAPTQDLPVDDHDPRLGPAEAPMRLVVFSSFQCPGCQEFAHEVRSLIHHFPSRLSITFKHFPLGTACNPTLPTDLHPRACAAAWAAEAAHRQGKFWPFHDALFATNLMADEDTIRRIARETDLDMAEFEAARQDPVTMTKVKSDVDLGNRLGVDATPSIFLNERAILYAGRCTLEALIDHLLERTGR